MRKAGDRIRFHLPPEVDPDKTVLNGIIYDVISSESNPYHHGDPYYFVTVTENDKVIGGAVTIEQNIIKGANDYATNR